ncbi:MAG TPA: hypothetical protein PLS49_04650 [Candidatus Woesebacteria bacterium]|nr:hypothetical protein [Candidatus Woesebacteria bacterium]
MKSILISLLTAIVLSIPTVSFAEEPVEGWKVASCMTIQQCKPIKDEKNPDRCSDGSHHVNRLRVDTSKSLPPNSDVYLIECVKVNADETYCTTADPALDAAIQPLQGHLDALKTRVKYNDKEKGQVRFYDSDNSSSKIGEGFTKLATDASGNLILPSVNKIIKSIEWKSHTPEKLNRNFKLWTPIKEEIIMPEEQEPVGSGGQQQAILTFPLSTNAEAQCDDYVSYDPEGRVFDALTLDPIPNVNVTLLQSDSNTATGNYTIEAVNKFNTELIVVNPILTKAKDFEGIINAPFLVGSFNFFVVDGFYKLLASHTDYEFLDSSNVSRLHSNASKIYSDIYFSNSAPIQQQGQIEHRDIPLFPKDGKGKIYPETFHLLYDVNILENGTESQYKGQVSHPFAKAVLEVCAKKNNIEVCNNLQNVSIAEGAPDKNGKFDIALDQNKLELGQYYKISFQHTNLTTLTLAKNHSLWDKLISIISSFSLTKPVFAQTPSVSRNVQPIASYLEGYAYDSAGHIIPNAKVYIYESVSKVPMIQTEADQNGYFRITSEYLPTTEYTIGYGNPENTNEIVQITTAEFLTQNKEFITVEKIDPYIVTTRETNPRRNITPSFVPPDTISVNTIETNTSSNNDAVSTTLETVSTRNNLLLISAVLLLLIATAGTFLGIYIYRKKNQEPQI